MPPLILRFQRSYYPGVLCVDELRFPCASIYHLKVGYSQLRFRHHPPNHSRQPVFLSDGMFCDVCRRIGLSEDGQAEVISVEEMKTHHETCASFLASVALECFICTRLWNSLRPDEQRFISDPEHAQCSLWTFRNGGLNDGFSTEEERRIVTRGRLEAGSTDDYASHPSDFTLKVWLFGERNGGVNLSLLDGKLSHQTCQLYFCWSFSDAKRFCVILLIYARSQISRNGTALGRTF